MRRAIAVCIPLLALAWLGCSRTDPGSVSVGLSSSTQPVLPATVVPGPTSAIALVVTVTRVEVHVAPDNMPPARDPEGHEIDDGWITVFQGQKRVDLLESAATEALLGSVSVPAGKITMVRLTLANPAELVIDGHSAPVSCPSCSEAGFKILVAGDARVQGGGQIHFVLDLDQKLSVGFEDGVFWLKPVLRVGDVKRDL